MNEVFNRFEKKYMLDGEAMQYLCNRMPMLVADKYCREGSYSISSLYYDTNDDLLIRTSLQKPSYREKLRLRCYDALSLDSMAFVEIKKKVCGRGNKRRSAMRLGEAYDFLATAQMPALQPHMNAQVLREVQFMLQTHDLQPRMLISYDRRAYTCKSRPDLRITFDSNIQTRRCDLRLEAGNYGKQLLPAGQWLMEIKVADAMPVWLVRLLSEMELYPVSFSKYGTEYKKSMDMGLPQIYEGLEQRAAGGQLAAAY